ncbi:hypothetical protein Trydic_g7592 [Trypoxylus dichotomus]
MGSPLSAVANFYTEKFEQNALDTSLLKSNTWLRYVDDTFIVWNHGRENLDIFLRHLNNIHPNNQFTTEFEKDGALPFLDVLVYKKRRWNSRSSTRASTYTRTPTTIPEKP